MIQVPKIHVLFVCMGNICRSPLAEGIFKDLVQRRKLDAHFVIQSAATEDYHIGDHPDRRSILVARNRHVDISQHRVRQVTTVDFQTQDFILAMDQINMRALHRINATPSHHAQVCLLASFAKEGGFNVIEDPYYSGIEAFEEVASQIQLALEGFLSFLEEKGVLKTL